MKFLSYAWTILVDLVAIGVLILIFSRDFQPFERIVISLLVMIYLNAVIGTAFTIRQTVELHLTLLSHNFRVESRSENWPQEDIEDARHALDDQAKEMRQAQGKYLINLGFNGIGYFIALANLVRALWF